MGVLNLGKATSVFERNYNSKKRLVVNRGGTRSSKTHSICQLLVNWLMTGEIRDGQYIEKGVANVVRKYRATTEGTVQRTFDEILEGMEYEEDGKSTKLYDSLIISRKLKINQSKKTYKYNGRMVEFIGADSEQKLKGVNPDILYCNEADELDYKKEFFQLNIRTKQVVFLDFNPADPDVWINTELEQKRAERKGDVDVIVSTYLDNYSNLTEIQIEEIEDLEETDDEFWQVYGLGNYGKIEGLIFPKTYVIDQMPVGLKRVGYAIDFGFTTDPTALVMCGVIGRNLYIDELVYQKGLLTHEIHQKFKNNGIDLGDSIVADNQPITIADLQLYGWNIFKAAKGAGSIVEGINVMKGYKIHTTKRSAGIRKELKKYKWKVDKNGDLVKNTSGKAVPIDLWNHSIDATRYYSLENLDKPSYSQKLETAVF